MQMLIKTLVVMVVLPDLFWGMGVWRNSMETQKSGHTQRYGPEVKNGKSGAKEGVPRGSDAEQSRRR